MNLRELDDRILPAVSAAVRRLFRLPDPPPLPPRVPRVPRAQRMAGARAQGPAPAILRLRSIDDRYARRGPLALLRDIPQLGYVVLGALLLTAGATVAQRADDTPSRTPDQTILDGNPGDGATVEPVVGDERVGPILGESVPEHVRAAADELDRRARTDDEDTPPSWAVVSFHRYLTPVDVAGLLADTRPDFVLFRVPPLPGTQAEPGDPVRIGPDVVAGIRAAFRALAAARTAEAVEKDQNVRETENDPAFQAEYASLARQYRREAAELTKGCACVFAVLVKATARDLLALSRLQDVRSVDIAPAGRPFKELTFRGLLPEEKVIVTAGNHGNAGGNG